MKLKCIKDWDQLTKGHIYESVEVNDPPTEDGVCVMTDNGKYFFFQEPEKLFEEVEETLPEEA